LPFIGARLPVGRFITGRSISRQHVAVPDHRAVRHAPWRGERGEDEWL